MSNRILELVSNFVVSYSLEFRCGVTAIIMHRRVVSSNAVKSNPQDIGLMTHMLTYETFHFNIFSSFDLTSSGLILISLPWEVPFRKVYSIFNSSDSIQ